MNNDLIEAILQGRLFLSCQHEPRAHRTVAELLLCALPGSRWVRDSGRELEWPEYAKHAVIWCGGGGFTLYAVGKMAKTASANSSQRLCPSSHACTRDHQFLTIEGSQLAPVPQDALA